MISNPTESEKYLIFRALIRAIDTNTGLGFHNADQGHPAYEAGAQGGDSEKWGDSPEKNELFKLLRSFPSSFHENGPNLSNWQLFCSYAIEAYRKAKVSFS